MVTKVDRTYTQSDQNLLHLDGDHVTKYAITYKYITYADFLEVKAHNYFLNINL